MKMKNKVELKKYLLLSLGITLVFLLLMALFTYTQYQTYNKNYNYVLNNMIQELKKEYPELETNKIVELLNSKNHPKSNVLKEYGIDIETESAILTNQKKFTSFLLLNIGLLLVLVAMLSYLFWHYTKRRDKKLKEITEYIEEINKKNYKLDIQDNTEDDLSRLKNEVYKTTIMLKEQAENEKKDKSQLKESLSDISHQLKTPLTSIIIMLDNILENDNMSAATRKDFIKAIYREISNISFLVQVLLKLSKFDANTIVFTNKKVKIKSILEQAISNVAALCDLKDIEIIAEGNKNATIYCDFNWQVEAITNILKNCVEHSKENTQIHIRYEENKLYSKIVIKDQGIGINKEDLPHIFERFYKGKNASKDSIGIGLALASIIIKQNNGNISVDSILHKGTTFTIKYSK